MTAPVAITPSDSGQSMQEALKSSPPPTFKPSGSNAEMRGLEQTLALLNNASLTGAVVPPEEREATKALLTPTSPATPAAPVTPAEVRGAKVVAELLDARGATMIPTDPLHTAQVAPAPAAPAAAPAVEAINRIVLTGRTGVGKDFIAAQVPNVTVLNLDTPIWQLVRSTMGNGIDAARLVATVQTIKAWGDGVVSDKYPITPARLVFMRLVNFEQLQKGFGFEGCWAKQAVAVAHGLEQDRHVIVTGVETAVELNFFLKAGFRHYHVACSSASFSNRPKRPGANDTLAAALDQNVIKELSQNRTGRVLRCVWSDTVNPPSNRVLTVAQWLKEISLVEIPQTGE